MSDAGPIPPIDIRQRRMSQVSRLPRVSQSSTHSARPSPPTPTSPRKAESGSPATNHIALPRTRLTSLVTRLQDAPASAPSPLAQVFQPLIVNDEMNEHDADGASGSFPGVALSYGPATRKRLQSTVQQQQQQQQQSRRTVTGDSFIPQGYGQGQSSSGHRRFPTSSSLKSGLGALAAGALSTSPDDQTEQEPTETAGQLEEDGEAPVPAFLEKRLDRMEERQKRIEELLVQLTANLQQQKS